MRCLVIVVELECWNPTVAFARIIYEELKKSEARLRNTKY